MDDEHPVVAIGASAGGLAALEKVLARVEPDSGAAYVVIQHLSPDFKSHMTELLGRATRLAVSEAVDQTAIEPNHVYVIPPRKEMILAGGRLLLTDKDPRNAPSLPIDTFLRSLAQDAGQRAVAIVLSGTGSDGARGVREVKQAGGTVVIQHPDDAEFDGMPMNAVATGVADAVLPADEIAAELQRLLPAIADSGPPGVLAEPKDLGLQRVLEILHARYDIDFACYKPTTFQRRVRRRMDLVGTQETERYAQLLVGDVDELQRLYQDLLIGVTEFFRDPRDFEQLAAAVREYLTSSANHELRVWVAGCATGEEVYSVAMVIDEARVAVGWNGRVRLFATDVHDEAVRRAAAGVFPAEALETLTAERRAQYFTEEGLGCKVVESLRDMVIFANHNLAVDAPFTQLDLVCCRNVLIYFQPAVQARVLALFHFALRTGGLLFLGSSESLGKLEDEFERVGKTARLYSKRRDLRLLPEPGIGKLRLGSRRADRSSPLGVRSSDRTVVEAYESLLERYMPSAFLLDDAFHVMHCFGGAERFITFTGGRVSTTLPALLDGRLRMAVSGLLDRHRRDSAGTYAVDVENDMEEGSPRYRIAISSVASKRSPAANVLVELRRLDEAPAADPNETVATDYVQALERDLELARDRLQTTVEDLEAANEELQAANEELVASNEELQSTNEELRSVNEELTTVNSDYQRKIEELTEVTEDLENLLQTINVGVLILDRQFVVRHANARVGELLRIDVKDAAGSIEPFKANREAPGLYAAAAGVLRNGRAIEQETRTPSGRVLVMHALPYRSAAGTEGAVLTFVDVTGLKHAQFEAARLSAIVRSSREAIIGMALDGTILSWNHGAERLYGYTEDDAVGRHIGLIVPVEKAGEVKRILSQAAKGEEVPSFETTGLTCDGRAPHVLLSVSPIRSEWGDVTGASAIALDITDRKIAEERASSAVAQRDKFLAMLSHELRNPLMALSNANEILLQSKLGDGRPRQAHQIISRQVKQMSRLLEDTLDASRLRHDKIELHRKLIDLREVIEAAMDATRDRARRESIQIDVELPPHSVGVKADAVRMQQVIVNLTQNALNHCESGDTVSVRLGTRDEEAVLEVIDQGAGVPPEALGKLFEPFFQASRKSAQGMGLGLSLVRAIVRAHYGEVYARSEGLGKGATFEVRLPLADSAADTATDLPAVRGGNAVVLVVDDDDASRESLVYLLGSVGYEVYEARDGREGLKLIDQAMPSVAILDVGLPDISGLEVARQVRKHHGTSRVRLIALTGFGQQSDREAAIEAGCDMHLVKPVDFATLEKVIAYQVSR